MEVALLGMGGKKHTLDISTYITSMSNQPKGNKQEYARTLGISKCRLPKHHPTDRIKTRIYQPI